jgi:glutamate formiminotransferase
MQIHGVTAMKKRVFISFDYDNDVTLKTFLVGQAKLEDSPFDLADWSIKEHIDDNWKAKARTRIKAVDVVCVICGNNTDTAVGVSAEVKIAQEEGIPYFLLNGYSDKTCIKPKAALSSDKLYKWTWPNLKSLIGGGR